MTQHDYNILDADGATVRADLNSLFQAIVELNSGAAEPATKFQYMWWADTTNAVLKQRNGANTAWEIRASLSDDMAVSKTAVFSVGVGDFGKLFLCNGTFNADLPAAATAGNGFVVAIKNTGTGTITIDGSGAETIDGATTVALTHQYDGVMLESDGSNWFIRTEIDAIPDEFPSGTLMLFQQTTAPTGWTKQTTHNNKALRVVSGAAGSAGATAFTTVFGASKLTGPRSLSIAQLAAHTHGISSAFGPTSTVGGTGVASTDTADLSTSTGSGTSHDHTLSLDLQYVDLIIASKD